MFIFFLILGVLSQVPTPASIEDEIRKQWDQFISAWESKDANACASFYLEDGVYIPPRQAIITGRADVGAFYETLFAANESSKYTHTTFDLQECGDMAFERGTFKVVWTRSDQSTWTFKARCLVHWKKVDGDWKIASLIFNRP